MCQQYHHIKEPTGLNDINGLAITEDSFLKADDQHYRQRVYHYVFWDDSMLCWNTIKFCEGNQKLDHTDELFRVQHRKPEVCERPKWVTDDRIKSKLQYRTNLNQKATS